MSRDLQLLKDVLSIPSHTYEEERLVQFICDWLKQNSIEYYVDEHLNVYATKQTENMPEGSYFPCVIAHTDTVHSIENINVVEEMLPNSHRELKKSLKAYNDDGEPTGIGGDDKCGVFACLELLKELPNLKAVFFVAEETGCHGSRSADKNFFFDVGYAIQFDAPENWMVTETCFGTRLYDKDSVFFEKCDKILTENMNDKRRYMAHPYTDVWALKNKFDFSCINFSIGYYNYHTEHEYVVIEDTFNGIEMGKQMIESLGYRKYQYQVDSKEKKNYLWM